QVRDRTHWNSANLQPVDPVALGLCSQMDLDFEVQKAAKSMPPQPETETGDALMPASQTEDMPIGLDADAAPEDAVETAEAAFANFDKQAEPTPEDEDPEIDADNVFAKLKALKGDIEGDGDVDANADIDN
ncbi:MAG: cell cycle transcriptional regulator TrcR, partial [Pseudomonadota bacterium]